MLNRLHHIAPSSSMIGSRPTTRPPAVASAPSSQTRLPGLIAGGAGRLATAAVTAAMLVMPLLLGTQAPVAQAAALPVLTGVSPSSGPPAGGTQVTVNGSGFSGATEVSFGSTPGLAMVLVSDTQLTVLSPAGTGVVDVTVTGPGGTSATTLADKFAYGPTLVTGISPASGPALGGTVVTVSGSNFTGATAVNFGSTPGLNLLVVSNTQLTVVAPAGTGVADVTVTGVGGTSTTSSADRFAYSPVVTGVSPKLGPPTGGTVVTVSGSNFTGATTVSFGSTPGLAMLIVSDTQLTVVSPAGTGVLDVTVSGPGGTSETTQADKFAYGAPVVTGISPARGPAVGGTVVTVNGSNFNGATAVTFGSTPGMNLVVVSDGQLSVVSPPGAGKVDLTVTGVGGTSAQSSTDKFSYTRP